MTSDPSRAVCVGATGFEMSLNRGASPFALSLAVAGVQPKRLVNGGKRFGKANARGLSRAPEINVVFDFTHRGSCREISYQIYEDQNT